MPRLCLLALLCLPCARSVADDAPVPLRRLCIDAPVVVLATPLDPLTPIEFRVHSVLRGEPKPGDILRPVGLTPERMRSFAEPEAGSRKPRPRRIAQALLFLDPVEGGKGYRLRPEGVRLCSEDGHYLVPNAKDSTWKHLPELRWPIVIALVKQDLAAVDQLRAYRRIGRPTRRVEALLGWIQERRSDFAALHPGDDESPAGWEHLQFAIFDWILEAAQPPEAWRAIRLYAELNHGDSPRLPRPLFSTPEGRTFLLDVAGNERLLLGDRLRALHLLALPEVLTPSAGTPGTQPIQATEQSRLIDQLSRLLAEKNDLLHAAVSRVCLTLGASDSTKLARLLPLLVQTYRATQPGPTRDDLAQALSRLASPEQWKELTGNSPGYFACLRDLARENQTLTFWLTLQTPGPAVYEAPTLVIEKFGTLGFVSETKRFPIEPTNLDAGWAAGWNGDDPLVVQFNLNKLGMNVSGAFRVRVEGFAGKGAQRVKWTSEPRKFVLPVRAASSRDEKIYVR